MFKSDFHRTRFGALMVRKVSILLRGVNSEIKKQVMPFR